MTRTFMLLLFELRKILSRKKAFLFIAALNVIPLIASIALMLIYIKFKSFGLGSIQYLTLFNGVKKLLVWHVKLFSLMSPFFLALIIGDSFSTELNKGHMKMMLLTPVKRWQIIFAKTAAVMVFLLLAICLGGVFLQSDVFLCRLMADESSFHIGSWHTPIFFISGIGLLKLLSVAFLGNLMVIGVFILCSLFFESAVVMAIKTLTGLIGIQFLHYVTQFLMSVGVLGRTSWAYFASKLYFTKHYANLFDMTLIENIISGRVSLFGAETQSVLLPILLWAAIFYALAAFIFNRRQVLH